MVRIVSDSTCDLPDEVAKRYNISIVPLHIVLGDKEYKDRLDLTQEEIFAWSDQNKTTPKTSAVAYSDAYDTIKPLVDAGDDVIVFVISESMSNTGNVFRMAAEDTVAPEKVHVYNTHSLSNGVGLLAVEASIMASKGLNATEIIAELDILRDKVSTSFVVDSLTYLARGGRCNAAVALAGGVLKIHPKIYLEGGAMDAGKKYRGTMSSVVMNYVKDLEDELLSADKSKVYLVSTKQDESIIDSVRDYLKSLNYFDEIIESLAGGVISSHCGPGTVGVIFRAK